MKPTGEKHSTTYSAGEAWHDSDIYIFIHNIYLERSFLNKETNFKLSAYPINEEIPAVFPCVQQTKRPQLHSNRGDNHINLFLTE